VSGWGGETSMLNQTNGPAAISSVAEGGSANPKPPTVQQPGEVKYAPDGPSNMMEREQPKGASTSKNDRSSGRRSLEAYIERRARLADWIRAEHPSYTQAQIEERLEQFGV
jgi:hypothetical protein